MKIQERTIYHCSYCGEYRLRQKAMEKHEIQCAKNPVNYRPCHMCIHLKVSKKELSDYENGMYIPSGVVTKEFWCERFKKSMYSYKAEVLNLPTKYKSDFEEIVPMPHECDGYENQYPDPLEECRNQEIAEAMRSI